MHLLVSIIATCLKVVSGLSRLLGARVFFDEVKLLIIYVHFCLLAFKRAGDIVY